MGQLKARSQGLQLALPRHGTAPHTAFLDAPEQEAQLEVPVWYLYPEPSRQQYLGTFFPLSLRGSTALDNSGWDLAWKSLDVLINSPTSSLSFRLGTSIPFENCENHSGE